MQKRVSLARTVAVSPSILLFDEPTTGLDPVTTNAINHLIFELSRQTQDHLDGRQSRHAVRARDRRITFWFWTRVKSSIRARRGTQEEHPAAGGRLSERGAEC